MKYILTKGFIAIDGISLTIGEVKGNAFCVNLIPETLHRTFIGKREVGISSILKSTHKHKLLSIRWSVIYAIEKSNDIEK